MKLSRLVRSIPGAAIEGSAAVDVSALAYDSRRAKPGSLFFALPGANADGSQYAEEAGRRGAVAMVCERGARAARGLAVVRVDNARRAMADVAAEFHGHPSRKLKVVGVTGTNGKTTTTFMVRDILRGAGISCGLIGTIHYEFGGRLIAAARTTPESLDLQQMLDESVQAGCGAVAMEVSSQGLAADRLLNTRFAVGVFTNLTADHLDFHKTMEAYFAAKKRLFESLVADGGQAPAVVNLDDAHGARLAADPALAGQILTYGLHPGAAVRAVDVRFTGTGSSFGVRTPWGESGVEIPLAGRFNVSNALAAMAACGALGTPLDSMVQAFAGMGPVPGRLERIDDPRGTRHIFVDYAHTEDALRNVLQTLRETAEGRLLCVFGCGGNRDRAKRPRMGAAVAEMADHSFVTSDNPRGENPGAILEDILAGMDSGKPRTVESDRAAAIRAALRESRDGDTLVVAGKGHETYQEVGGRMTHFDDREVLRSLLLQGM